MLKLPPSSSSPHCRPSKPSPTALGAECSRVCVRQNALIPPSPYRPLWHAQRGRILGPLWIFYSPKAHRIVRLRGDIVYYAWLLLEGNPEVIELCEQPFSVRLKLAGRWRAAVVDIWARMRGAQQIFIVALYRRHVARSTCTNRRMDVLTAWAEQSGAALAVMPDTTIWRDPQLLSNWSHIMRFLSAHPRVADLELGRLVLRAVTAQHRMTLKEIESTFPQIEPTAVRAAIFRLLHANALRADLSEHRIDAELEFTIA